MPFMSRLVVCFSEFLICVSDVSSGWAKTFSELLSSCYDGVNLSYIVSCSYYCTHPGEESIRLPTH